MMKRSLLIATMIAAGTTAADAAPPAWCSQPQIRDADDNVKVALGNQARDALANLVGASCSKGRDTVEHEAELAAARARWLKELGMTEAQWETDVVPWATRKLVERNSPSVRNDPKVSPSAQSAIGQYAMIRMVQMQTGDALYITDVFGDRLTEAGRLAYIEECLAAKKEPLWALCQADIDAFDRTKLYAEMTADKSRDGYERMVLRLKAHGLKERLVEREAAKQELIGRDAGYAKLWEIAAQARKAWAPDAKALAALNAMDDARVANSKKLFEGCEDTTWDVLAAAVGKLSAAKVKELKRDQFGDEVARLLINDRDSYLAAAAFVQCRTRSDDRLASDLGRTLDRWPGFRGPRTAGLTAMLATNISLDDRDAKIQYPEVRNSYFDVKGNSTGVRGVGPVSAVKRDGDKTTIEFVKKLRKERVCEDWKDTNRVVGISPSGTFMYDYICIRYGTITVNDAPSPKTVSSRYATGVTVGAYVIVEGNVVFAVAPKADATPTHVVGVGVR